MRLVTVMPDLVMQRLVVGLLGWTRWEPGGWKSSSVSTMLAIRDLDFISFLSNSFIFFWTFTIRRSTRRSQTMLSSDLNGLPGDLLSRPVHSKQPGRPLQEDYLYLTGHLVRVLISPLSSPSPASRGSPPTCGGSWGPWWSSPLSLQPWTLSRWSRCLKVIWL